MYGLLGQSIPFIKNDFESSPVSLEFETEDETDDLKCGLSSGSAIYISAKRKCGNDRHLRDTVSQWLAQLPLLAQGDLLALATAEPAGIVKDLGPALDRRRRGVGSYSASERKALNEIKKLLRGVPAEVQDRILDTAFVMYIEANEPGHSQFDIAAALLENVIVPVGKGRRAVKALGEAMHTDAGKAFGSRIDDWVRTLQASDIEVYEDGSGVAGQQAAARLQAVNRHRERLSKEDGIIDLLLLAEDIPPLQFPRVADGIRVVIASSESNSYELLVLARRWSRILLVGSPGTGKSTALRQLAARWSSNTEAPIPVFVSLRAVARRVEHKEDLTLSLLCETAAQAASANDRGPLAAALEDACGQGQCILLLDGLDECGGRRPVIAEGLKNILSELHVETGVIVATRWSGRDAAKRLMLPKAELSVPWNLAQILKALLQHVAEHRHIDERREEWLTAREQWLDELRTSHSDLTSVPLLAILLTLIAANSSDDQLPENRTAILTRAIRESVERWEQSRSTLSPDDRHTRLTSALLLAGFACIGHVVASSVEAKILQAMQAVMSLISSRWGKALGEAQELAEDILWFWDEYIGAFIQTEAGLLSPRSRVFAEIADAMWITYQDDTTTSDWVIEALKDNDRRTGLLLAANLDARVLAVLLSPGDPDFPWQRAAYFAADAIAEGTRATPGQEARLIQLLASAANEQARHAVIQAENASQGSQTTKKGFLTQYGRQGRPGWICAYRLASVPLSVEQRPERDRQLRGMELVEEEGVVVAAASALTDATVDHRSLTDAEAEAVQRLLDLPLPPKAAQSYSESRRMIVFKSGPKLLYGHAETAVRAVDFIEDLDQNSPGRINDTVGRSSIAAGIYFRMLTKLKRLGHDFSEDSPISFFTVLARSAIAAQRDRYDQLLQAATMLGEKTDLSLSQRWRISELCDLFAVLEIGEAPLTGLEAVRSELLDSLAHWMQSAADSALLEAPLIAEEARLALTFGDEQYETLEDLIFMPASRALALHPDRLTTQQQEQLVRALVAQSDWVAYRAFQMLLGIRNSELSTQLLGWLTGVGMAERRQWMATIACLSAEDPVSVAQQLFRGEDAASRVGSVEAIALLEEPSDAAAALLGQACADKDLTVQLAARGESAAEPESWSCPDCAAANALDSLDCVHCETGARPGL